MKAAQEEWLKNETERLFHLLKYNILDSEQEQQFDEIVELASRICKVPVSLVSLVDKSRQWFKAHKGLDIQETPRVFSFCAHAIQGEDELLEIENATQDQRFSSNPFVKGEPHICFYAGYPLITSSGHKLGSLCVIDTKPRRLDENQRLALKVLSQQIINLLELRLKNQQLNHTFEKAQLVGKLGFFEADLENDIWMCSDAFFQMFGLEKKYVFSFKEFKNTIYPKDRKKTLQHWKACLKNKDYFDFEYNSIHKASGVVFYVRNRCEIIREKNGPPLKIIGIIEDITEIALREKLLKRQNEQLKKVNQELDNFVYRISHDLRSPISSAMGLVNIMRTMKNADPRHTNSILDRLIKCLHTEDQLIRDISDYFHNVRESIDIQAIDFNELLKKVVNRYEKELKAKKIRTKVMINQTRAFYSDPRRIFLVLNSLISNAVRFTKTNDIASLIEIKIEANEERVHLFIKDNGMGIEGQHKNKIYDMFYRGTNHNPGAGLGLYIAKDVVTRLSGEIKLQSVQNEGSVFEVFLPSLR